MEEVVNVIVLGDRKSGKSTLLDRLQNPDLPLADYKETKHSQSISVLRNSCIYNIVTCPPNRIKLQLCGLKIHAYVVLYRDEYDVDDYVKAIDEIGGVSMIVHNGPDDGRGHLNINIADNSVGLLDAIHDTIV